ncbi:MAG: hypothetical protein CMP61_04025 [Flavobacteriales bacterium]|nr:hypothetical protein [Flavobacteriales bacterium]|tara:strand:- start:2657 stop:3349 length:693 start_codon:yes stop_codon:yes gene_type:complete
MADIVCELRVCTNISTESFLYKTGQLTPNDIRLTQVVDGLKEFFKYNSRYIESGQMDVYISDNTIAEDMSLNEKILDVLHPKCQVITCLNNNYGCFNKGAGELEQWQYCQNKHKILNKYKWFIHFEPRQFLLNNQFIDKFMEFHQNMFTSQKFNTENDLLDNVNTGLFVLETRYMLQYINSISPYYLVANNISIEYVMYRFLRDNNIKFHCQKYMNVLWYDWLIRKTHNM